MKPERHVWEEDSTHRAVAGKEYDEVWDYAEQLKADRDEYRNLYHMGEAKISSREAIIEQLSESELAKDVTRLEAENDALRKAYKKIQDADSPGLKLPIAMTLAMAEMTALLNSGNCFFCSEPDCDNECIEATPLSEIPLSDVPITP